MTNFKVGQKVVCVDDTEQSDIKKNKVFTISKVIKLCCDEAFVLLEINHECGMVCGKCGRRYYGKVMFGSYRFRPLSYSTNVNFEVIANFSPKEEKSDVPVKNPEPVKNQ